MARTQKLKVYRTPIGFHDAYVAASSQKAALEAWGSDANLFARGIAEQVSDEALIREPLESPGIVIKRLRGSADDHVAALPPDAPRRSAHRGTSATSAETVKASKPAASKRPRLDRPATTNRKSQSAPRSAAKSRPRPSRSVLEAAERELEALTERHEQEDANIRDRQRALERERRALEQAHEKEITTAEQKIERRRKAHGKALDRWIARGG